MRIGTAEATVARVRVRGRGGHGMESDAPMEQTQWHVTEWRHQKAIWVHVCRSEAEALEAAGLRE
jgi:hypothetical protein